MSKDSEEVVVIGGGIIGLCTAWALTGQGIQVKVIDQGAIPNALGASVDEHRLIRYPYGRSAGYSRMVDEAFAGWDKLWHAMATSHYVETGILALSTSAGDWTDRSRQTLTATRRPFQIISPGEIHERFPYLKPDGIRWALFDEQGGVLLADRIITGLYNLLEKRGVRFLTQTRVESIDPSRGTLYFASGEQLQARQIVLATGAWAGKVLPALTSRITPWRQVSVYVEPPSDMAFHWTHAPAILDTGGEDEGYAVPPVAGTRLKWAAGAYGRPGEPEKERTAGPGEKEAVSGYLKQSFVAADQYRLLDSKTCYYARSVGNQFIIEEPYQSLWVITGGSGHMFKFGAAIGLRLADTLTRRLSTSDLSSWAAGKLAAG